MKLFVSQGGGNGESAAVQLRARRGGGERLDMTLLAAHFCEQRGALLRVTGRGKLGVACGGFAGTDETGETIDVGEAVGPGLVIGFPGRVAKTGDFIGLQPAGNAHFVEVRVGGKGQQARLLVLPSEAPDAGLAGRFNDRNVEDLAANLVVAFVALLFRKVHKSLSGDRLHTSIYYQA